ncbi:MAG: transglutaminase domain-containing protein [Pseudobutyrivibrio sp.]|nr:transglutaminase domain-containing protein [Pseudobutyrivibrio sp.]
MKLKIFRVAIIVLTIVVLFLLAFPEMLIVKTLNLEIHSALPPVSVFIDYDKPLSMLYPVEYASEVDTSTEFHELGTYPVVIKAGLSTIHRNINIIDIHAPEVTPQDQTAFVGTVLEPDAFIKKLYDGTETTLEYVQEPDWESKDSQTATIRVTDQAENITEFSANYVPIYDDTAPEIGTLPVIRITVGDSVSYKKGIEITDDYDESPTLEINADNVNTDQAGTYTVIYTATDAFGNSSTKEREVIVSEPVMVGDTQITEETINELADKVLDKILTSNMSQYDQAKAIYWYTHDNIQYKDGAPKAGYISGAYQGLHDHKGDCYTYAMTAKCLLTRAGIVNMDIERIPEGNKLHFWNLIDIGEGWYHFDTTRRADKTTFFYWTDAQIKEYSDSHRGTHNYDPSKYPYIQ